MFCGKLNVGEVHSDHRGLIQQLGRDTVDAADVGQSGVHRGLRGDMEHALPGAVEQVGSCPHEQPN